MIWSGGDLLSHVLRRSTIGATGLNGRVRDGIGCFPRAVTTRPRKGSACERLLGLGALRDAKRRVFRSGAIGTPGRSMLSDLIECVFPCHYTVLGDEVW